MRPEPPISPSQNLSKKTNRLLQRARRPGIRQPPHFCPGLHERELPDLQGGLRVRYSEPAKAIGGPHAAMSGPGKEWTSETTLARTHYVH